jgi:hypothetical protein
VALATRLLRAGGATVFLDVDSIEFGDRWEDALAQAVARCERVLVFWSAAAATSAWVEREWNTALSLRKRIVPLSLDLTPLPPALAQFQGIPGLADILLEAKGAQVVVAAPAAAPAPLPADPSASPGVIPDDWDPFAPEGPGSPAIDTQTKRDSLDELFGLSGGARRSDPLADLLSRNFGRPSAADATFHELGKRFTARILTGAESGHGGA